MNVLSIQSSIKGSESVTRALSAAYIGRLRAASPGSSLIERDLAADPVPHLNGNMAPVVLGGTSTLTEDLARSDQLILELEQSDLVVGAPMYNFGIPSSLKAWFDNVIRAGRTFRYVNGLPQGLLAPGKRAVVFVASGGAYSEGAGKSADFLVPHLRFLFAFIGITDVTFIKAEGLAFGAEVAQAATDAALAQAKALPV